MLTEQGFERIERIFDDTLAAAARETLFRADEAGTRCLLDEPIAQEIARAYAEPW